MEDFKFIKKYCDISKKDLKEKWFYKMVEDPIEYYGSSINICVNNLNYYYDKYPVLKELDNSRYCEMDGDIVDLTLLFQILKEAKVVLKQPDEFKELELQDAVQVQYYIDRLESKGLKPKETAEEKTETPNAK